MADELSMKNTKQELLGAYTEIQQRYSELKSMLGSSRQQQRKTEQKQKLESVASEATTDDLVGRVADLKVEVCRNLDQMVTELIAERDRLQRIQDAAAFAQERLEAIHDIKVVAGCLEILIEEYEKKKIALDEDHKTQSAKIETMVDERRAQWKKEAEDHQLNIREAQALLAKDRAREREQYEYSQHLERKRWQDEFSERKESFERELATQRQESDATLAKREAAMAERETELDALRQQVGGFVEEKQRAVDAAVRDAVERETCLAQQRAEILVREVAGERNVAQFRIVTLEAAIAKQDAQIEALNDKLTAATLKVQEIASRAIEGAAGSTALSAINKIALEQARNRRGEPEA